jgi:uncharacterized membrane protein
MKKLTKYFLQGLLYIAPFSITVYIIYALFNFIDNLLEKTLLKILNVDIPGLGLLIIVAIIILMGIIGHTIIARPFKTLFNSFINNMPFLKVIYSALNDLFSAFVGKERKFNKPVLVLVNPVSNLEKLGFLTEEDLSRLNETSKVAVYFPHSYNFSGELYIVPKENIKSIDVNPAEVMKFIVSAGVSGWEEAENKAL